MNIKGLLGNMLPTSPIKLTGKVERAIKSDSTSDRDANGQQAGDGKQEHREPMSEEQIQKALEKLRALSAVKEHGWTIEIVHVEKKKFVFVKDGTGAVIRRIPELELWSLSESSESGKGQLLKKTA